MIHIGSTSQNRALLLVAVHVLSVSVCGGSMHQVVVYAYCIMCAGLRLSIHIILVVQVVCVRILRTVRLPRSQVKYHIELNTFIFSNIRLH